MPPIHRPRIRVLLIAVGLAIAGATSVLLAQPGGGEMPLSIHRIVIPPDRLAKELEKVQQGTLLSLPLAEFDARLARVRKAAQARMMKPRLTRAFYRAELVDRVLTRGSGQWTIHHPGRAPAVLPIDPFNLAVQTLKWETGADAVLAEFDGKSLGLLISEPGDQTALFDWSARGTPTNEGLTFNLAIPPCPITAFEFTLPADYWLTAPKSAALVIGPSPAASSRHRLWQVQITGQAQLELTLRKIVDGGGPATTVFTQVLSTQSLAPERAQIDHEFQIEILHGGVRELSFDGDGSLEPYEVSLRSGEIKAWQWKEAAKKDSQSNAPAGGVLTIQFHHPMQGKIQGLKVRSVAPRPSAKLWTSPALHVRDSLSRGETLKVQLHPSLAVGKWDPGTFQLIQVATEGDGTQTITLADAAPDAGVARRPAFGPVAAGIDLHTTEQYAWRLDSRSAVLRTDIEYALGRGSLAELRVRLPKTFPAYQLESVEMQPADVLHRWYPSGDFLIVELLHPLTPAKKAQLKVQLRADYRDLDSGSRIVHFPELEPVDSTKRQGAVAITVDPMLQAQLVSSTLPPLAFDASAQGKGQDAPSFAFAFRDQKLSAAVRLAPQPGQLRWHGRHAAKLAETRATVQFRWDVEPIAGAPSFLDLQFAPGFRAGWKLRPDEGSLRIHHWERLPLQEALPHLLRFGVRTPMQTALLDAMLPAGTHWRFHLTEPLRTKASLAIEAGALAESAPGDGGVKTWFLPMMTPVQRSQVDQTLSVDSPSELIDKARADGPLAIQTVVGKSASSEIHAVQSSASFPNRAPSLTLWTKPSKPTASMLEYCDDARCTTEMHRDGRLTYRIQFRLWHWRDRTCEMRLPTGVRVLAVKLLDHWLDRVDVSDDAAGTRVTLPFDQSVDFVRYEILARREAASTWFLSKVEVPLIGWPLPPFDLGCDWRLEEGLMPLGADLLERVGLPDRAARQTPSVRWLRQWWNWGGSWWPSSGATELAERRENQKQAMLSAESQFRTLPIKSTKLADVLEQFAVHHLKEQAPLVIDDVAFRALGVGAETLLPAAALNPRSGRPFWEALGLVYVPCPGAALLTSPARMTELGIDSQSQASDLEPALAEAFLHGRDASGGFFFVLTWLQAPPTGPIFESSARTGVRAHFADDMPVMTQWRVIPGPRPAAALWVIDVSFARAIGVLLAVLIALVLWRIQHSLSHGAAFRVCLLALTAGAVVAIWLPPPWREFFALPVLLVQGIGLLWCFTRLLRRVDRARSTGESTIVKPAAGAVVVALLICMPWMAEAQPSVARSYPVLILEGMKPAALVTPELLGKFDELENPAASGAPEGVLVKAKYAGRITDGAAAFDVQIELHTFKDQVNLVIPLTGVQLQEGAFLDGAPAYPTVHKNGYVLPIRTKGVHHLRLSFTARIAATNEHVDLRFTIPKLGQNEFTLQIPASMPLVQCLHCSGEETSRPIPGTASQEWHAQLGYENAFHLRWANTAAAPALKMVEVREAHCWDLRPSSFALASAFNVAIGKGSMSQLSFTVPEGLHIRSVEAMALTPGAAPPAPVIVKQWQMLGKGAQRRVAVEFAQPVSGQIMLGFEFVAPSLANLRKLVLPLPAPLQGKSVSGILGYRLSAQEVRSTAQNLAVTNMDAESFEQQWRKQWAHPIPPELRAYSFQRKAQQAGLELMIQPPARQAQMQIRWSLEHQFADMQATATVNCAAEDLSFLEFYVDPALTLASVAGPDVRRWHVQDSVLQVWLRQSRKQTTLELTGWRAFDKNTTQNPKKRFAVPMLYPLQTQITSATLQLQPARGIRVEAEVLRRLRADSGGKLQWIIEDAPYEAVFWLRSDASPPQATLLTKVQKSDDGIDATYRIRLTTDRGKLPTLKVHLKNWGGEPMQVDAPGAVVQAIRSGAAKESAWTVKYSAGLPQEVQVTLRGRVPTLPRSRFVLPTVEIEGIPYRAAWCAWTGVDLASASTGKKLVNDPRAREEIFHVQNERELTDPAVWHCARSASAVEMLPAKTTQDTNPHILTFSEEMKLTDTRKWLHKASFWILAPDFTELRMKFANRIDQMSVFLDQRLHSAWTLDGDEATVALGAAGQLRHVELLWIYAQEPSDAPILTPVQIASGRIPTPERVLWLRHGLIANAPKEPNSPTMLTHLLQEAESHMLLSAALAQDAAPDSRPLLQRHQRAFDRFVRQADYLASLLRAAKSDFDSAPWQARLKDLRERNVAYSKERGYTDQRQAAERLPLGASILMPTSEIRPAGSPLVLSADQSAMSLDFAETLASSERRARSELVLLFAVFLLVFSYFRHGLSFVRLVAPEMTAATLLLAMWLAGAGMIGVAGVAIMILVRLAWLIRIVQRKRQMLTTDFDVSNHPSTKNRTAP